ncbi:MAG TPA: 4-hydroxythreonine-4-phosphate dehydrogenase PdxA [Steroidobacteraceae bacterium]|nr:4-hydroxythreonine-4-phosphate dehydrogenase PdxA [Steroidobacteraceae bacterium]
MKPTWKSSSSDSPPPARLPRIALTSGEPAGIGPDLCLALAEANLPCELVCLADERLLGERAALLRLPLPSRRYAPAAPRSPGFTLLPSALDAPCTAARLDPRNARAVLRMLDRAIDGCLAGEFDALVTAPLQKSVINDAGIPFQGHTEYLAERTGAPQAVMLLAADKLRVALATTHLPLAAVSAAITPELLSAVLHTLDRDLRGRWHLPAPRIGVCGLNPHAGESGYLGREELEVIGPALTRAREQGIDALGPYPADTLFLPSRLAAFDVVLAMYHDQGLPVIKHACFDRAVNVTLGLPILRTSVDHGTALDLAGTGRADAGSLLAAVRLAIELCAN